MGETCFVMMPFSGPFPGYYDKIYSVVIREFGLTPIKVDEVYTATQISHDIFSLIQQAKIILADVTGKNPNVNYELGIAHALGKKTVIVTQKTEDVPFDYKHIRYIAYDTTLAGWEETFKDSIRRSLRATLQKNSAESIVTGVNLSSLCNFLLNTALDARYEVSKDSDIECDLVGNCKIKQRWSLTAKTSLSHFIHGVISDVPGSISDVKIYDQTNGMLLSKLTVSADEKSIRNVIFLSKTLNAGEKIRLDIEFTAENYLSGLFSEGRCTMFQRPNSRRAMVFSRRQDKFSFPDSPFTRSLRIAFDNSAGEEESAVKFSNDRVLVSASMYWPTPSENGFSYELRGDSELLSPHPLNACD